ncbi:MAG: SHOCT domain-containing protein [Candidatus Dormibacteraeota bacterium]|jgi:putative membrane protein|nr:SHOCT domain-containing protein [Candidatus Dormibacteraeota bacterium]
MNGAWGPAPFFFGLCWLIPLGLLALWIVFHRRSRWGSPWGGGWQQPSKDHALAILQERFARGEIDEDEYLRRRTTLDAM